MTGLLLLAIAGVLWFCYALVGAFVALGGHAPLPRSIQPLLEPTSNVSTSWGGRLGAVIVAGIWLVVGTVPQIALLNEALTGHTQPLETLAIALGSIACLAWLGFLSLRYLHR